MEPLRSVLHIPESVDPAELLGVSDQFLRRIEDAFDTMVSLKGNVITMVGASDGIEKTAYVFSDMIRMIQDGEVPSSYDLDLFIDRASHRTSRGPLCGDEEKAPQILTFTGKSIRAKTPGQAGYIKAVMSHTLTFCTGPAGTGKTYLAMAMAVSALRKKEVARIVLARPVVEAGESLGFLPGTMQEKLDPYVRPLYDALFDMCEGEKAHALIADGTIEIAPLAFMRGRTFSNAFVILDEAQNTTPEQMKMAVTRIGFSSKFVINGDMTQRDLMGESGLDSARRILKGIKDIAFVELDRNDVVRHSLVAKIVDAYARDAYAKDAFAKDRIKAHG